mmetsp:Transcript_13545/g.30341  ORF Transcript_13545/g.30341 Transcript_13545/m.30341 type:complete len:230 (-) Transcript_13545:28-717(-)
MHCVQVGCNVGGPLVRGHLSQAGGQSLLVREGHRGGLRGHLAVSLVRRFSRPIAGRICGCTRRHGRVATMPLPLWHRSSGSPAADGSLPRGRLRRRSGRGGSSSWGCARDGALGGLRCDSAAAADAGAVHCEVRVNTAKVNFQIQSVLRPRVPRNIPAVNFPQGQPKLVPHLLKCAELPRCNGLLDLREHQAIRHRFRENPVLRLLKDRSNEPPDHGVGPGSRWRAHRS